MTQTQGIIRTRRQLMTLLTLFLLVSFPHPLMTLPLPQTEISSSHFKLACRNHIYENRLPHHSLLTTFHLHVSVISTVIMEWATRRNRWTGRVIEKLTIREDEKDHVDYVQDDQKIRLNGHQSWIYAYADCRQQASLEKFH